jgi:adenylate cyclase
MEIERKWLIPLENIPEGLKETSPFSRVKQGYLNPNDEFLIRVRHNSHMKSPDVETYKLEIKSLGLFIRDEYRIDIDKEQFDEIYAKCPKKITKTRYYHFVDDVEYEIDFYDDYDFLTLEIEFKSIKDAEDFQVPDWFGEDVTYKPEYKNVNLAK